MLKSDVRSVVETFYAALARGDAAALLALAANDVTVTQSELLPWGGRFVGREAIGRFAADVRAHIVSDVTIDRFIEAGDRVAAVGWSKGYAVGSGRTFAVPLVHLFTIRNGQLKALDVLVDVAPMLDTLT